MSYGQNGVNGYSNGYRTQGNRYDDDAGNSGNSAGSGRRVRRAGGYGGFGEGDSDRLDPSDPGPPPPRQERRANGGSFGRSGGGPNRYGDSFDSNSYDAPPPRSRDREREREREQPPSFRTRDRLRPSQNESRMYGNGPAGQQLEDVVDHINGKWSIMS